MKFSGGYQSETVLDARFKSMRVIGSEAPIYASPEMHVESIFGTWLLVDASLYTRHIELAGSRT